MDCRAESGVRKPGRDWDQGWFHGRRWLVWLFPLTYPSYRVLLVSRESAKCSFLKKKFFYNNSPIYSNNLIASKKLVTWHPLGRHIPIPYSSWTETYQKNHLSKKFHILINLQRKCIIVRKGRLILASIHFEGIWFFQSKKNRFCPTSCSTHGNC